MVLGLCDRFRCLPSVLYAEDSDLLRLVKIQQLGNPEPEGGGEPQWP